MARKAVTPSDIKQRERTIIDLAFNEAERQIKEGTASSQVITHFLKLATAREKAQLKVLDRQEAYLNVKRGKLEEADTTEDKYERAIQAMRDYEG